MIFSVVPCVKKPTFSCMHYIEGLYAGRWVGSVCMCRVEPGNIRMTLVLERRVARGPIVEEKCWYTL